jgi:hypothetical protein
MLERAKDEALLIQPVAKTMALSCPNAARKCGPATRDGECFSCALKSVQRCYLVE